MALVLDITKVAAVAPGFFVVAKTILYRVTRRVYFGGKRQPPKMAMEIETRMAKYPMVAKKARLEGFCRFPSISATNSDFLQGSPSQIKL